MNKMFDHLNQQWEVMLARVADLEKAVADLQQRNSPPVSTANPSVTNPQFVQPQATSTMAAPTPGAQPPQQAQAPQEVPTLDQLRDRLMQLNEAQGGQVCVDLLKGHGGQDQSGNVNIRLVPGEQYAGLYAAIGSKLGLH